MESIVAHLLPFTLHFDAWALAVASRNMWKRIIMYQKLIPLTTWKHIYEEIFKMREGGYHNDMPNRIPNNNMEFLVWHQITDPMTFSRHLGYEVCVLGHMLKFKTFTFRFYGHQVQIIGNWNTKISRLMDVPKFRTTWFRYLDRFLLNYIRVEFHSLTDYIRMLN